MINLRGGVHALGPRLELAPEDAVHVGRRRTLGLADAPERAAPAE
ncbi:hypothetical protein ACIBVL_30815 [Streptomyces sp. NPDC049687]